jgi:hypothetical protein
MSLRSVIDGATRYTSDNHGIATRTAVNNDRLAYLIREIQKMERRGCVDHVRYGVLLAEKNRVSAAYASAWNTSDCETSGS